MSYIQFALALLNIVRWVMTKIDREQWKREGRNEALAESLAIIARDGGVREQAAERIRNLTDAEIDSEFGSEFRP